jgi:hypothetical protein
MDNRNPITGHTIIEGEHLEAERLAANRGGAFTPMESFWTIAITLVVIAVVFIRWMS